MESSALPEARRIVYPGKKCQVWNRPRKFYD